MNKNLLFVLVFFSFLGLANSVLADTITLPNPLCPGGIGAGGVPADAANCVKDLPGLIAKITGYVSTVIGSLAVLMFVVAGILFVISGGNESRLGQAKKAAIYAAVGTAIALAGAGLVAVINAVIGPPPP